MKFLVLCTLVAGAAAGYSASTYRDGKATGYNGGYTTHFSGPNGAGVAVGTGTGSFAPGFAGFPGPTVDFNNFFQGIQANFANSMTQSYSEPGATASASSSLLDPAWRKPTYQQHNLYQQQFALQQALFQQQQAAFNGGFGGPGFGGAGFAGAGAGTGFGGFPVYGANFASAPNYIQNRFPAGNFNGASSSASFGPGGFHQTAAVYPGNPAVPNVDTRFGGSEQATSFQSGKPGFVGVSSFSSSSNINGQTHREAVTTVNDNGKVTTHRVHS
uniref:fibroin heavy chain isoform X2 n=1 Tax=Anopheles coluzzii TaxID=1518534 RepID=UPI001AAD778C|nr:fibroin heavy chain isoform X2 [Anopheles coluzzii]XP_040234321.1 fibroin heavy chain isoform X2 [Anopheles coluzzii]XP_040234322.1 fibroin heavy chain isoform X2 [Anopheles coluzzii]